MNRTATSSHAGPSAKPQGPIQPLWVRLTHWLNALAVLVLVASGWRIYNAAPFFPFTIPAGMTLGGWLGGALQWHFAAMWLLACNGLVYLAFNIFSGRLRRIARHVAARRRFSSRAPNCARSPAPAACV